MTVHQSLIPPDGVSLVQFDENLLRPVEKARLHVLTLTPFYPTESDEAFGCFLAEPLRAMVDVGVENTVLFASPFYRGRNRVSDRTTAATALRYFCLPKGIGLSSSGAFLFARIVGVIRKVNHKSSIDLIHAHSALPCGHAASLLSRELGIPYVITVHGLDAYSTNQVTGISGRWCERVSRRVYQGARRVICISGRVREEVLKGGSFSTEVIHNSVDAELFAPTQVTNNADPMILSIGDLIPCKGQDLLLHAIAELRQRFPTVRCEIVGDGPQRDALTSLAAKLRIVDRVTFCGRLPRKQVAEKFQQCMIFALLSRYEGLGCVYLEAMATGRPVVACHGQGIGDIIQNGHNGLLVKPGNLAEFISALATLLENPSLRRSIATAGHRTIHQNHTLAHQAENLARVYAECTR